MARDLGAMGNRLSDVQKQSQDLGSAVVPDQPANSLTAWKAAERELPAFIHTVDWRVCTCDDASDSFSSLASD
jgi:hypothetical protein